MFFIFVTMKHPIRNLILAVVYWDYALLFFVFFLIFVVPIFPAELHSRLYDINITCIYLFAALAVGHEKKYLIWFTAGVISLEWISSGLDLIIINYISRSLSILFFIFIVILFITRIIRAKAVDAKVILDAINGYLLISIVFSILIALVMRIDPQAFNFPDANVARPVDSFADYMYYSLVSITTLGYGDIVPKTPYAKSLATFISISGQFYIAILLALLVGKFASNQNK